jgi:RimJ/RimL family protein N-acetyltransferase
VSLETAVRTPRLLLRPLEMSDVPALWPFVSDEDFPRHMTWEAHRNQEETAAFIRSTEEDRIQGSNIAWGAVELGDGSAERLAGIVGLHGITRTVRAWRVDRAELGYWIGPPFQNRGFATEAARAAIGYAFEELGLHKVTVGCIVENTASRRVIEKLGFRFLGEQRDHAFRFGRWWNHLAYEMCVQEWRGQPS